LPYTKTVLIFSEAVSKVSAAIKVKEAGENDSY
jgi:hypothetical protein